MQLCNFWIIKSAADLNILLLKFVLLCQVDIQESFPEDSSTFNFRGIIWESKRSWREQIFQAFKEPKMENFGNHGVTSGTCWVYYKPSVLSNSEVRTYDGIIRNNNSFLIFIILNNFLHENLIWILNHIGGIPFC